MIYKTVIIVVACTMISEVVKAEPCDKLKTEVIKFDKECRTALFAARMFNGPAAAAAATEAKNSCLQAQKVKKSYNSCLEVLKKYNETEEYWQKEEQKKLIQVFIKEVDAEGEKRARLVDDIVDDLLADVEQSTQEECDKAISDLYDNYVRSGKDLSDSVIVHELEDKEKEIKEKYQIKSA